MRSVTELVDDTGHAVAEPWVRKQEGSYGQLKRYRQKMNESQGSQSRQQQAWAVHICLV